MIRTKFLIMIIIVVLFSTGCKANKEFKQGQYKENPILYSTKENMEKIELATMSDEDFVIKNENTYIELGGKYENLITNEKLERINEVTESKAYETYFYENFIIEVGDTIFLINLLTPTLKTSRGIGIGDSLSNIFEKYGSVAETSKDVYEYKYDGKILEFHIDKNRKVENIILWIYG